MDKKEFVQQIALSIVSKIAERHDPGWFDAKEEDSIAIFATKLANKIYKKGDFTDLSK